MHSADLIILAVLVLSLIFGFMRGLVREAFSLTGWVLAILVARWFNEPVAIWLAEWVETPSVRLLMSYGTLFCGTLLAFSLASHVLSLLINDTALSLPNRILGGVFGVLRGCVLVLIALMLLAPFVKKDSWFTEASLPRIFLQYEPLVRTLQSEALDIVRSEKPGSAKQAPEQQP